jgi:hypothetical protein
MTSRLRQAIGFTSRDVDPEDQLRVVLELLGRIR